MPLPPLIKVEATVAGNVLTVPSYVAGSTQVFLNGDAVRPQDDDGWTETAPGSGTITLKETPIAGDKLLVALRPA